MKGLLDVNALMALAWPTHEGHGAVMRWIATHRDDGWATCPLTISGFVRLSMNPRVVHHTLAADQLVSYLEQLLADTGHSFLADDVALPAVEWIEWASVRGYRQVTDLHLVALAKRHDAQLVTLDRGVVTAVPESVRDHVTVLEGEYP